MTDRELCRDRHHRDGHTLGGWIRQPAPLGSAPPFAQPSQHVELRWLSWTLRLNRQAIAEWRMLGATTVVGRLVVAKLLLHSDQRLEVGGDLRVIMVVHVDTPRRHHDAGAWTTHGGVRSRR